MMGLKGELHLNEPLTRYNSWRVGGRADRLYIPANVEDLSDFLQTLPADEPLHIIGLGSNLLVRDGGIRGTVIVMHNALKKMQMDADRIYAEAGVTCAKLAKFSAREAKQGAEFMAGIPGTVGGALMMNAGCHGGETWDIVSKVMTMDRQGQLHGREANAFRASYRHVQMPDASELFIGAWFRLQAGDTVAAELKIKQLLAKRLASQPLNLPNAGSTFRNPEGDYAARLIEACGLKGYSVGGAQVSEKHANFIVNLGEATARDIEILIDTMREKVYETFGVRLQQEVRVMGEVE